MILNFFTVALRNFIRNKILSAIHVLGLAIGISASLVIFLVVQFENSFDKFEEDGDRIYRVVMDVQFNGIDGHGSAVPGPLATAVETEVTGIDAVVPVMTFQGDGNAKVSFSHHDKEQVFKSQAGIVFTKPAYFKMIGFEWLSGSPETSLKEPFSVVLTEQRARLYFPDVDVREVVGKRLTYNDVAATVTGIVKDLDEVTDFKALEFLSYSTIFETTLKNDFMMEVWNDWMAYSSLYVKLSPDNDRAGVVAQLNQILDRQRENDKIGNQWSFGLQPLEDIHFNATYIGFNQRVANRTTILGLIVIAGFLLLLACINFTNLATAQASQRAKEIAIRKSIGGSRKQLIFQFLAETFCITFAAALLAMAGAPLLLDLFSDFIPQGVGFMPLSNPSVLMFLFLLVIGVSLIAGIYPSLVLSGLRPSLILKGQRFVYANSGAASFRKTLTVFQFMTAQIFVFGAFIVSKQINFSLNTDPGYQKEAIVYFDVPRQEVDHREQLVNELRSIPGITKISLGFLPPAVSGAAFGNITYNNNGTEIKESVQVRWGEPQYIDVYGIRILAGRNVRVGENLKEALINETYAKAIGFTNPVEALNHQFKSNGTDFTIVGVMNDFRESSTRSRIGSMVFMNNPGYFVHLELAKQHDQWPLTLEQVGAEVKKLYPERDFNYTFFDESIARFYDEEQKTSKLLNWAMALSIVTSCLGLLGLVMHTSETRTKEIGIRKILGATVSNLVGILSFELVKLVMIAFAIAVPMCWWGATKWLEGFAYRTEINLWVFGLSGLTLIMIALITISGHIIKTAVSNPIDSLRSE